MSGGHIFEDLLLQEVVALHGVLHLVVKFFLVLVLISTGKDFGALVLFVEISEIWTTGQELVE